MDDSTDDERSEESDTDYSGILTDAVPSCGSCCKEKNAENEALRKRLQKLHRRLNISCTSSLPAHCFVFGLMWKKCVWQDFVIILYTKTTDKQRKSSVAEIFVR